MTDRTIWRKAYDLIDNNGWTTGTPKSREGCYCVGGAISEAVSGDPFDMEYEAARPEVDAALHQFADHLGLARSTTVSGEDYAYSGYGRVYVWNDGVASDEDALKALEELDELERASK